MSIQIQFEEPQHHICYLTLEPLRLWEEFDAQIDMMAATIRDKSHPVAILMDLTRLSPLPDGNVLGHLQRASMRMPDNVDITVFLNAPYAFVNFVSVLMQIRPRVQALTFFAHSLDEGQSIIRERRKHNAISA